MLLQNKELLNYSINKKTIESFLKRLNKQEASVRKNKLSISINEKNYEELYYPEYPGQEHLSFDKLLQLENSGIVSITYGIKRTNEPQWNRKTKIIFNLEYENICREILGIHCLNEIQIWQNVVNQSPLNDVLKKALILSSPITIKSKSHQEVLDNIHLNIHEVYNGMSKRQISAKLFWGLSKELDTKPEVVQVLNGTEAPVMLNVCGMSSDFKEILFIENYDTYVSFISTSNIKHTIIIYSAGFGSSALRIREVGGCALHYSRNDCMDQENQQRFESWLWNKSTEPIPVSFFGDFDYSGIEIFKSLRRSFSEITFFKEGYDAMSEEVKKGNGHSPEMADKEKQKYPEDIDDVYCDEILLPLMNEYGFYDQEGVFL